MQEFESPTGHHWKKVVSGLPFVCWLAVIEQTESWTNQLPQIFAVTYDHIKHSVRADDCAVYLLRAPTMATINANAYPFKLASDVLALPTPKMCPLPSPRVGEIFINYDAAQATAKASGHSLTRELSFLLIHGLLHLFGYDHKNEHDKNLMFGLTQEILQKLGIHRQNSR